MSDSGFGLGINDMVNASVPSSVPKQAHKTSIVHCHKEVPSKHTSAITHKEEKITLVLVVTSAFGMWHAFH